MMQRRFMKIILFAIFIAAAGWGQHSFSPLADRDPEVRAEALTNARVIAPGSTFKLAVRLVMAEGWHVYGPGPDTGGLPTSVNWKLPDGFIAGPLPWPEQIRFETPMGPDLPPLESFGYEKELVLVQSISAPADLEPGQALRFHAQVAWLGCKEACVPGSAELSIELETGEWLVLDDEKTALLATWLPDPGEPQAANGGVRGADVDAPSASVKPMTIWAAFGLAFLGGLLLNLMPCVLPIVSVKIIGFIEQAGDDRPAWKHGALFAAGIILSFWLLAGLLFALRQGAQSLGWGFHLQQPTFVFALILLMFMMALNFFGVFELGTSLVSVGGGMRKKSDYLGSFLSGMLATIVATPCTAPFMGAALGFALYQPLPVFLAIFTALGLGMAAPYMLLSSSPALLKYVPKPGAWMEALKQFMGFPLLATVVGLLYVIHRQTGALGMIVVLMALLLAGMAAWVYGRWGTLVQSKRVRIVAYLITTLLLLACIGLGKMATTTLAVEQGSGSLGASRFDWQEFSIQAVKDARQAGKPVFIDFTAEWCTTCKVNKIAFTDKIAQLTEDKGVVMFVADWTNNNPEITQALESYGRTGVPLYVLYPAQATEPVILPQILTEGRLRRAFEALDK